MNGQKNTQVTFEPEEATIPAIHYFPNEQDGDRLILRDYEGGECPW